MEKQVLKCKVVLLPTEKASQLGLSHSNAWFKDGSLHMITAVKSSFNQGNLDDYFKFQHLYILSYEEIKEGDWYICPISKKILYANNEYTKKIGDKKIEATTDTSLKIVIGDSGWKSYDEGGWNEYNPEYKLLPQIHQSFIEAYVKAEDKINEVEIEVIKIYDEVGVYIEDRIKTRSDNTVIIIDYK